MRGVGQSFAACASIGLSVRAVPSLRFEPARDASGVGHVRAASVSVVPECLPLSVEYAALPEEASSFVVAVGQCEEPLAPVRRANVGRSHKIPFRIEPERGKVGQHSIEPKAKVPGDVLEEGERRSALRDDARDFGPQVPLVSLAELLPGDAERLAGVARNDEIHRATPALAVERAEIVPDRSAIQGLFFHPGHEDGRGEGVPLEEANGAAPAGQAEINSADAGAETEGSKSHTTTPSSRSTSSSRSTRASRAPCGR